MSFSETTLVLGAGASAPYGYPVGSQLREMLCGKGLLRELQDAGYHAGTVTSFQNRFRDSAIPSIDFFLAQEANAEFAEIGKIAIATVLASKESAACSGWYSDLFYHLISADDGSAPRTVNVITFNYDRSLEFFLHGMFRNAFKLTNMDAAARVRSHLNILHVFGDLGPLPEYEPTDLGVRPYGVCRADRVADCANRVHLIQRDNLTSESFDRAYDILRSSEFICFLGFGFLDENLRRLKLRELCEDGKPTGQPVFFASAYGLPEGRLGTLRKEFRAGWHFGLPDQDAEEYLRQSDVLRWGSMQLANPYTAIDALGRQQRGIGRPARY